MNNDIATLAREAVDAYHDTLSAGPITEGPRRPPREYRLARAVLAVADLANELDQEGNARMEDADPTRAAAAYAHAARIRTALNGDNA